MPTEIRVNYRCKGCKKQGLQDCHSRTFSRETITPRRLWSFTGQDGRRTVSTYFEGVPPIPCPGCSRELHGRPVQGTVRDEVPCNSKCTSSKGHVCECRCGGLNHGSGWG
jgi:hypothetical protein